MRVIKSEFEKQATRKELRDCVFTEVKTKWIEVSIQKENLGKRS